MSATVSGLSWSEVLAALLSMLGAPVTVTLVDAQSGRIVACQRGILGAGVDLAEEDDAGEALYFNFVHDHGSGIVLTRSAFKGAGLMEDGSLAVEQDAIGVIVEAGLCSPCDPV